MPGDGLLLIPLILLWDHWVGDPERIGVVPHPVIAMGKAISGMERLLYPSDELPTRQIVLLGTVGVLAPLIVVLVGVVVLRWLVESLLPVAGANSSLIWLILSVPLAGWLLAARGLSVDVGRLAERVGAGEIDAARSGMAALVSRRTDRMDSSGLLRSGGESLAENFNDAVVAPLFYWALFGLEGIVVYKLINTYDSMWGYRDARYLYFGRFAARLDDVANFVPARLSALLLWFGGFTMARVDLWGCWRVVWRFAGRHPSPNAGYPEAMMAGLLGLGFGGPREYGGGVVESVWIGDGRKDWIAADLTDCLELYWRTLVLLGMLSAGPGLVLWIDQGVG